MQIYNAMLGVASKMVPYLFVTKRHQFSYWQHFLCDSWDIYQYSFVHSNARLCLHNTTLFSHGV